MLLCLCQMGLLQAQILKEKKQQSKILISRGTSTLERIYEDNGKFYQLLSNNNSLSSKNNNSGKSFVLKSNDSEFSFETGEIPISVMKNKAYTATYNFDTYKSGFKIYNIGNQKKSLHTKNVLELNLYSDAYVLKNGDIVATEGTENGGVNWIGLYSPDLKLIHKFTPFQDEFDIVYDANENYIAYVAQLDRKNSLRIALYGAFADKKPVRSKELEIDKNHRITAVTVEKNYVTLLLSDPKGNQLIVLNDKLEVIHKRNLNRNVNHHKLIGLNGKLFFCSGLMVLCYNIEKNNIDWKYQEEHFNFIKTSKGYKARIGELFLLDNENLVFAEVDYEDGVSLLKKPSIKVIDCKKGKVVQKIVTGDLHEKMQFIASKNEAHVFDNHKMISYEKQ